MSASLVRIDGNETSAGKIVIPEILAQVSCEFVPGDERRMNEGRANSPIFVVVQVTAAESDGCNVD
jgi:hypothetical protein